MNRGATIRAFSLMELMIVMVIPTVLALLLVPTYFKAKQKAQRIRCTSYLKQTGMSFRQWAIDKTNLYPMHVSVEFAGTKERIALGETFRHFEVMSNELNTPLILVCPADKERVAARSFSPGINNSNVSYFVGLEADETNPQGFLTGDRTIFKGTRPADGIIALTTNNFSGWSKAIHQGGINVALADGSVQGLSSNKLWQALAVTGLTTNWLQLP